MRSKAEPGGEFSVTHCHSPFLQRLSFVVGAKGAGRSRGRELDSTPFFLEVDTSVCHQIPPMTKQCENLSQAPGGSRGLQGG